MNPYNKSNMDWIMVQNVDQVERIAVQPMGKAWIMVQNEPIFALRTSDAMGLTSTEYYSFKKYEKPANDYVTSADLMKAIEQLKEDLNESISSIKRKQPGETIQSKPEPREASYRAGYDESTGEVYYEVD